MISLLKTLSENIDSEYPQKIFEIGRIFEQDESQETGIKESEHLTIALISGNFTELKQILEYLGRMIDIEFKIEKTEEQGFINGRTGKILFENKNIGFLGEAHPNLLKSWHLTMSLACLEINLEEVFEKLS